MESLTEIIVALLKNSLDANCTSIAIRICLELFWIQILDNGDGISKEDLQNIGKCCLLNIDYDRKKPSKQFASLTGESLLNIIGKCEEVLIESIDSSNGSDNKSHSRLFKQQTSIAANESSQRDFESVSQYQYIRKSRGTTVTLKNIFYQDPERQQNHSIKEDYKDLLVELRALALIHYDRSFTLQDLGTLEVVFKSKRLTAFLPKYCELYHLTETDIDVTTCRKDDVLIECYFSEHQNRSTRCPIRFTFINGLPSSELLPTVNGILTQQKHDIDFVIVVTFPRNDILTQLSEPIVRNCLLRCLNQYKESLKQRKEQQHSISPTAVVKIAQTANRDQTIEMMDCVEKRKERGDEEDVLYGLSQPPDDRQTTFDKCSRWLKTNDFDVPVDASPGPKVEKFIAGKPHTENETRQKINFFDDHITTTPKNNGKDEVQIKSTAENKLSLKLPLPKFYSMDAKGHTKYKTPVKTSQQLDVSKINRNDQKKEQFDTDERPPERTSFLNMASEINDSKITIPETKTFQPTRKLQNFAKREKKKLVHSPQQVISPPQHSEAPMLIKKELTFFPEFEESKNFNNATSRPIANYCSEPNETRFSFQQPEETIEPKIKPSSIPRVNNVSPSSHGTAYSGISNAFAEPLFLAPVPEDDTYNISSPKARFYGFDLVESYRDFHHACQETTQNFKIAIEPSDSSDSSGCECCSTNQFNHEIKTLRQPFNTPRNILAKVGNRHDGVS